MISRRWRALADLFALVALAGTVVGAQGKITTPKEQFGFNSATRSTTTSIRWCRWRSNWSGRPYGGSMPSGWLRFVLERFEFPLEVVYAPTLEVGDLAAKYDVLVFVDGAIPAGEARGGPDAFRGGQPNVADIPAEYRGQVGNVAVAKAIPQLKQFFESSEAFRLEPSASLKGLKPVAWFESPTPLRSGCAWGQSYLNGTVAMLEANVGKGQVFLFGPEVAFRDQPHGTFKFLFKDPDRNNSALLNADAPRRAALLGACNSRYARSSRLAGRAPRRPRWHTYSDEGP